MAETTDLGMQELFDTAKNIRQKMDAGEPSAPLLQQIMEMVEKCNTTLEDVAMSQNSLVKSVSRMRGALERQENFSQGLVKSIALVVRALQSLDLPHASSTTANGSIKKSWPDTITTRTADPAPTIAADSPDEMVRKGVLLQTVRKFFGPRGGKAVTYNPVMASQMLLEGKLTKSEHRAWKTMGRLPDHVSPVS